MSKRIRIENPTTDCRFTSLNRAQRFLSQGRAVWAQSGVSIRFVEADHRHESARLSAEATRAGYERAAHTGLATIAELANLPMVAPGVALGWGRRKGAAGPVFRFMR